MKRVLYSPAFALPRLAGLFLVLFAIWIDGVVRRPRSAAERGQWVQAWCRRLLRYLRCDVRVSGTVPAHGLIAANHVSYVDVMVLGALMPAVFVAKSEVRGWPLIGAVCARGGVIFLDRSSARSAALANRVIADALRAGAPVVVFPEGTTSDGSGILPLHAALFQAALTCGKPIVPAALSYGDCADDPPATRERVAYWGDATLLPHLFGLMRLRSVGTCVRFFAMPISAQHRTEASALCEAAWRQMLALDSAHPHDEACERSDTSLERGEEMATA